MCVLKIGKRREDRLKPCTSCFKCLAMTGNRAREWKAQSSAALSMGFVRKLVSLFDSFPFQYSCCSLCRGSSSSTEMSKALLRLVIHPVSSLGLETRRLIDAKDRQKHICSGLSKHLNSQPRKRKKNRKPHAEGKVANSFYNATLCCTELNFLIHSTTEKVSTLNNDPCNKSI